MVSGGWVLERSRPLRLVTLFLFYFTQGIPLGVFTYAVPTWMAAHGASAADTAWVVGIAMLPWTLKLINGFVIDRYTYLPMGRRRAWIIGAQSCVFLTFLVGAVLGPGPGDLFALAALGFCANMAVTVQDVAIDSLAIDIMAEDERAKASGIMFGAQIIGIAAMTALAGALLQKFGAGAAMMVAALIMAGVAIYGLAITERSGERHLPWTQGSAHSRNVAIQIDAWVPLLRQSFAALATPLSLLMLPVLLMRAFPAGAIEAFHPVLATQTVGLSISQYTGMVSSAQFAAGCGGLLFGGWLVDRIGAQRSLALFAGFGMASYAAMALAQALWADPRLLTSLAVAHEFVITFVAIALIPMAMRLCHPAVAATQFTLYMACANFGRPLGAWMSGLTAGQGMPVAMYWIIAAAMAFIVAMAALVKFPHENRAQHLVAEDLPQGEGIAPRVD